MGRRPNWRISPHVYLIFNEGQRFSTEQLETFRRKKKKAKGINRQGKGDFPVNWEARLRSGSPEGILFRKLDTCRGSVRGFDGPFESQLWGVGASRQDRPEFPNRADLKPRGGWPFHIVNMAFLLKTYKAATIWSIFSSQRNDLSLCAGHTLSF